MSSVGHYVAYILAAREDMTVTHVGVRAGTSAGSPTLEVRIETVDSSGMPSGTLWATNTNGTTGTVSSNSDVLQALTASASITKGQVFCVKFVLASGTSQILTQMSNGPYPSNTSLPYVVNNTGTPTKAALNGATATLALGSSSTSFYQLVNMLPISAVAGGTFNNTSSAKRGLKFTPPMNCRAIGVRWNNSSATGDHNIGLYTGDASGTELSSSSTAYDGDYNSVLAQGLVYAYFDSPVVLTAGTAYRVAIEPTSATNANVSTITLPNANYFGASPGGANSVYTSLVSGTWTDSTTQIPVMDVILDQVDNGSGSGGVVGVIGG